MQLLNPAAGGLRCRPSAACFATACRPARRRLDRETPLERAFTGTGEWQLLEIEVVGADLTMQLNGTLVTRASGIEDVAGYIGIQSETSAVEFRRIDLEVIDSLR